MYFQHVLASLISKTQILIPVHVAGIKSEMIVQITGLSHEDGSGVSWCFEGYITSGLYKNSPVKGHMNTLSGRFYVEA